MGSFPGWSLALLATITAAGALLRFDAASEPSRYQSHDERSYAMIARGLVANHSYGTYGPDGLRDPMHWPPGAPVLFAIAHKLDPQYRGDGVWDVPAAYRWQAAVGTLTIIAAFALGALLAGPVAGVAGAAAVAFYPPLVAASGDLLSEPLGSLLVTGAMIATVLALRRRSAVAALAAGLLLGATILTRADLILVPAIAMATVAIAAARRAATRRLAAAARAVLPMLMAFLALLVPWTVFASSVKGSLVIVSSGSASNLWVGTYLPGDGTIFGSKRALEREVKRRLPQLAHRRPHQIAQVHVIRTVAARRPELSPEDALRAEAVANLRDYALGEPVAFAGMMARKAWRLWGNYTRGTYEREQAWIRVVHLLLAGLGFAGLAAGAALTRRAELRLIAAILLYVTALNAVLISEARHNLAVMPLIAAGGAAGGVLAARRLRDGDVRLRLPRRRMAATDRSA